MCRMENSDCVFVELLVLQAKAKGMVETIKWKNINLGEII